MLHRDFLKIVRHIHDKGVLLYAVNTNGAFITESILEEIRQAGSLPLLRISFDGIGFHDWMRGERGAEKRTLDAIHLCIEKGLPVEIQMNMNRRNLSGILPALEARGNPFVGLVYHTDS